MAKQSSNAYACGNNQNCGNFVTSTPTTRVSAPPGGRSSFSLGWGAEDTVNCRDRGNSFSNHARNRQGNSPQRVLPCQDYDSNARHSQYPQGNRSRYGPQATPYREYDDMFTCKMPRDCRREASTCRQRESSNPRGMAQGHLTPHLDKSNWPEYNDISNRTPRSSMVFGQRPRESSNTFASGSNQNCGNCISNTPTTRVVAPPGGHTSVSLAWGDDHVSEKNTIPHRAHSRVPAHEEYGSAQGRSPQQNKYDLVVSHNSCRVPAQDRDVQRLSQPEQNYNAEVSNCYRNGPPCQSVHRRGKGAAQGYVSEMPRHTLLAESEYNARRSLPAKPCNSQKRQSFEGVPVDRLQQMFRESKERMARMKQDDVDAYYAQSSIAMPDSCRVASDFRDPHAWVSMSRANSGSTTASCSRYGHVCDDVASDAGSDCLPLGAEWSSFNRH